MSSASAEATPPTVSTVTATTSTTSPTTSSSSSHPTAPSISGPASERQIQEARAALEASMHNIGSHIDSTLKSRAQNLHANNTVLDKQISELQSSTKGLSKETDKLKKIADDATRKLKEVGNVQNWAEVMEREFLILEETVRLADASDEEDYGPCRVCGKKVEESGEELLWCRGCDGEFHPSCVGLESVPRGEWQCAECETGETYLSNVKLPAEDVKMDGVALHEPLSSNGMVTDIENTGHAENLEHQRQARSDGNINMSGMNDHETKKDKGKGKENDVMEVQEEAHSNIENGANSSISHISLIGNLNEDALMVSV